MAKSQPKKHTRKWYLNNLCNALYGRVKVNYVKQDKEVFIVAKSGIADMCKFRTSISMAGYRKKMETLLWYTFKGKHTHFQIQQKNRKVYTRDLIIQNAVKYFSSIGGIKDDDKNNNGIDITQYEKVGLPTANLLYLGLSEFILEAIFGNQNEDDESDYANENIKKSFEQCLTNFKWELNRLVLFRQNTALLENQELYFDTKFSNVHNFTKQKKIPDSLGNCNYAIPLTLTETFTLPSVYKININIPVGPRSAPPLSNEEKLKRLVSQYIPISVENQIISTNEIFYTNLSVPSYQEQVEYCLSDISLIEDRKFYFITRIDKSILEALYDSPQSHEDLHKKLLQRAKEQIRKQNSEYKNIEDQWAMCILNYVDDVLCRFESLIRYSEYVQGDVPDEQTGINMLNIFGIKYHELFEKLIEYNNSLEQWNVVYICFDNAISSFAHSLQSPITTSFLRENTSRNALKEHKKRTRDIISSTYVESAIKKQEDLNIEQTNDFSIELTGLPFSRITNLISLFKNRVEKYLLMLEGTPISSTVSTCPEKNEKDFSAAQEDESQATE